MNSTRESWGSRTGFLIAAIASAIGLGNIWRFSYLAYDNGGGAFLIPYFVAVVVVGLPLVILEYALGQKKKASAPHAFFLVHPRFQIFGWWSVIIVMFGIQVYYANIIAWCLNYLIYSVDLGWGADANDFFFNKFLKISETPLEMGSFHPNIFFSLLSVWFISWFITFKGVRNGIERTTKVFMPILFILTSILVFWGLSLPGAREGIIQYLKPDFSVLKKADVWIDAFSQIFFTLSIGFGILIAYASYIPERTNIFSNAFITVIVNSGYSIFAGFAVFSTLGYLVNTSGKPFEEVVTESIGLAFVVYPSVISLLPAFPRVFGIIFFLCLIIAGITSSISIIEAFVSALLDKYTLKRATVVNTVCVLGFLLGIPFTFSSGLFWVDIVDHFLTSYGIVAVGFVECILIGWIYKTVRLREYINHAVGWKVGIWWDVLIRFIIPLVLLIIIGKSLWIDLSSNYGDYPTKALILIGIGWFCLIVLISVILDFHSWRLQNKTSNSL